MTEVASRDELQRPSFSAAQLTVVRVLSRGSAGMMTRDLATQCRLDTNPLRWACQLLKTQGLVVETKRRVVQVCGGKRATKVVSIWSLSERGRELAEP